MYECMHVCICMYVCMYVCKDVELSVFGVYVCVYVCMYVCMLGCVCVYVYMYICWSADITHAWIIGKNISNIKRMVAGSNPGKMLEICLPMINACVISALSPTM